MRCSCFVLRFYGPGLVLKVVNQYCAHSFTRNWQLPFLNQRKGEKVLCSNEYYKLCFCWEIRKLSTLFVEKKHFIWSYGSSPEVIKLFSCATQLNTKFVLLINFKLLTIANSFLLNIAEHENFSANKYENAKTFLYERKMILSRIFG